MKVLLANPELNLFYELVEFWSYGSLRCMQLGTDPAEYVIVQPDELRYYLIEPTAVLSSPAMNVKHMTFADGHEGGFCCKASYAAEVTKSFWSGLLSIVPAEPINDMFLAWRKTDCRNCMRTKGFRKITAGIEAYLSQELKLDWKDLEVEFKLYEHRLAAEQKKPAEPEEAYSPVEEQGNPVETSVMQDIFRNLVLHSACVQEGADSCRLDVDRFSVEYIRNDPKAAELVKLFDKLVKEHEA